MIRVTARKTAANTLHTSPRRNTQDMTNTTTPGLQLRLATSLSPGRGTDTNIRR
jgi:hypothetical protein